MGCKKGQPGKPCCETTCYACDGIFTIEGLSIAGTWHDSTISSCPCIFPSTVLLDPLTNEDVAAEDCTRTKLVNVPFQTTERCWIDYCDTLYRFERDEIPKGGGLYDVFSLAYYLREHQELSINVSLSSTGGTSKATISITLKWVVFLVVMGCEQLNTSVPTGYCLTPADPLGDCVFIDLDIPNNGQEVARVTRNLVFELTNPNSANCEDLCGEAVLVSQTGSRLQGGGAPNGFTWLTPLVGPFLNQMDLTAGQRFRWYDPGSPVDWDIEFQEPCWPNVPIVEILCNSVSPGGGPGGGL